jgi:hypothetical protein
MKPPRTAKEALLALGALAFGLICVPALIFVVGQQLIGSYEDGLLGFYEEIGAALAAGKWYAWMLLLWPYVTLLLLRFGFWLRRQRPL